MMTPIAPQDRNKVVVLLVAVVLVFGLLIWRVMPSGGSDQKPPEVVKLDTPTTSSAGSSTVSSAPPQVVSVNLPANATTVNPFRSVLAANTTSTAQPSTPQPTKRPPRLGGDEPGLKPYNLPNAKDLPTVEARLTGVMSGDPPLGVFVVAGKEEILRVGETLSNGLVVQSISNNGAVLKKNKMTVRLTVAPSK